MDTNDPNSQPQKNHTPAEVQGHVDVSGSVEGNVIGVNQGSVSYQSGDHVAGDKIGGDKVMGNKYEYHHPPRPPIDLAEAQQQLERLPLDSVPEPASIPAHSRIIYPVNSLFVGREDDFKKLAATLKHGNTTVIAAATGMGGIGKTQLASEFAHRYGQYFAGGVYWLSFADPAGIDGEIAACGGAGAMELYTDSHGLTQAEQVAKVYAEWAQPVPRLLIFDNCDDLPGITAEELLTKRLPKGSGCRVLVTSRRGEWHKGLRITALPLGLLTRAESIALLRSHRKDISDADANTIAEILGDLPLALSLAGSYLETYRDTTFGAPMTYIANLRAKLLEHRSMLGAGAGPSLTDHEQNVWVTFALSYQRLDAADPIDILAIAALARAAHFAPGEPFLQKLLLATLGDDSDDEEFAIQQANALRRLVALGLLEPAEGGALRLHRLITAFVLSVSNDKTAHTAVEQVLVNEGRKQVNSGYPAQLQPILAHLRHAQQSADPRGDAQAAELANTLGRAEEMLTNYQAAQSLFERALSIHEKVFEPLDSNIATSLNNLAGILDTQGNYADSRPLYERALNIREQTLGPTHPDTAQSLNNLAFLFERLGQYKAARPLYERALSIREQTLEPKHPDIALSLNNLAILLEHLGEYTTARPLLERALSIYGQLDPKHPDIARCLNNLAGLLENLGESTAARPLHERALSIREQVLGPMHPETATSLNNLAHLYSSQGEYGTAQSLIERVVQILEQTLGPHHPHTARSLNNLAKLLYDQGKYEAARPLYQRALSIHEQMLGPMHSSTATTLNNLANLYKAQEEYETARSLFERALAICEQNLGINHLITRSIRANLAALNAQHP